MGVVGGREGTTPVHGIVNGTDPVVKRAVILWGLSVVALVLFHVGGSKI